MGRSNQLRATIKIRQTKKSMWICFEAIIDDWGQFVSRLLNGISLGNFIFEQFLCQMFQPSVIDNS